MWHIKERLYLGNYWSGERALAGGLEFVHETGEAAMFSGVVSLCPMPLEGDMLLGPVHRCIRWLHLPIADGGLGDGEFAAAVELCVPFFAAQSRLGNVLVHCAAGMSRSVSIVAAILCSNDAELSVDNAFRQIALAKARAVNAPTEDADSLIAPAWEFRNHLRRQFAETSRRANGRP